MKKIDYETLEVLTSHYMSILDMLSQVFGLAIVPMDDNGLWWGYQFQGERPQGRYVRPDLALEAAMQRMLHEARCQPAPRTAKDTNALTA